MKTLHKITVLFVLALFTCSLSFSQIVVSKKLGEIEEQLEGGDFLRVHRSYIVRVSSIVAFNKIKNKLQLKEGGFVSVSRANRNEIMGLLADNS